MDKDKPGGRRAFGRGRGRVAEQTISRPGEPSEESGKEPESGIPEGSRAIPRGRGRAFRQAEAAAISSAETESVTGADEEAKKEKEMGLKKTMFAERPDTNETGRLIKLETNHFSIAALEKNFKVYRYSVAIIASTIRNLKITRDDNRIVFWRFVGENENIFSNPYQIAFDGAQTLFSKELLNFPGRQTALFERNISVRLPRGFSEIDIKVTISFIGPVDINVQECRLGSGEKNTPALQFLDIVCRQNRLLWKTSLERGTPLFYSFGSTTYAIPGDGGEPDRPLGAGRCMWYGMFSSTHVDPIYRPLVNIDVSHGIFYRRHQPVVEFLCEVLNDAFKTNRFRVEDLNTETELPPGITRTFQQAIKGLYVQITHREGIFREFRVADVVGSAVTTVQAFPEGDGTIAEYFQRRYGTLRYGRLPMLSLGSGKGKRKPNYMPLEHCRLAFPQRCTKKLGDMQLATLIKSTAVTAPTRKANIQKRIQEAQFGLDPWLADTGFGIKVSNEMTKIPGRVLPPAKVIYSSTGRQAVVEPSNGSWKLAGQKVFLAAAPLVNYGLIHQSGRNLDEVKEFFRNLSREAERLGVRISPSPNLVKQCENKDNLESTMADMGTTLQKNVNGLHFVFVVLDKSSSGYYAELKRVGDVVTGIMSQCILLDTIVKKSSPQTLQNIVLKVNAKMGGVNNALYAESIWNELTQQSCTLFIGADISHPPPFNLTAPSVAAIVSNIDAGATRYGASIKVQRRRREVVMQLLEPIKDRLMAFFKATKMKPSRLIFYRDGVSEGQFREVLYDELKDIRGACELLSEEYRPKITYIMTTKRHHTRFFCLDRRDAVGKGENIPPGTMVDRVVTSPDIFDFYLCSHMGIQGTSRPTRYSVLHDESRFSAEKLQAFTYALSNVYCRCTRSVSLPTPLYYAHWASLRAKHHLSSRVSDFGSDTMSIAGEDSGVSTMTEQELMNLATVSETLKEAMYFV